MKAYHRERFGDVDGIVLHDDPVPQPGSDQIVVRLQARSLNFRDLLILSRKYLLPAKDGVVPVSERRRRDCRGRRRRRPLLVGQERVAGIYFPRWRDDAIEPDQAIALHRLHPVIDRVFPLDDAKAAYRHFAARRHAGKVVIAEPK